MKRSVITLLLVLPFALFLSAAAVFLGLSSRLGRTPGYLLGFVFYWLVWCLLVPRLVLGRAGFRSLMTDQKSLFSRQNWLAAALLLVVTGVTLVMYLQGFLHASPALILVAIPCALIDGLSEEILWRGLYIRSFPSNPWLAVVYPSVGFALWHIVPQLVFPSSGGIFVFVLSTLFLGLAYGWIAYRVGSARWTALSHSLNGVLALSGHLAPSLLLLLRR
jgi:membrane protease YdiL (CAAX protease family)